MQSKDMLELNIMYPSIATMFIQNKKQTKYTDHTVSVNLDLYEAIVFY